MAKLLLEIGDADRPVELQYSTRCLRRVLSSIHRHGRLPVVNERAELAVAKVVEAVCERSEQAGNDFGMRRAERAV